MALHYQLSDIYLLSAYERAEFRQQRGITTSISAQAFLELINSPGPVTLASQDLLTAKLSPKLDQSLSARAILNLNPEQLQELALSLGLDSNTSNLVQRVLRVLRFKQQLIYDYNFVFPTQPVPLTELVCGQLKLGPDFFESFTSETIQASLFQQLQVPTPTNDNKVCNVLSGGIATNLVRVAATRIFGDPTRSFLEPIVNSIDAYRVKQGLVGSTGKFGLGFYSLLYWLVGRDLPADFSGKKITPTLTLISTYLDFTGELVSWTGVIYEDEVSRELVIDLKSGLGDSTASTTTQPGLKVTLDLFYLARDHRVRADEEVNIPTNQNQQYDSNRLFYDLQISLNAVTTTILLAEKYFPDNFLDDRKLKDFDRILSVGGTGGTAVVKVELIDFPITTINTLTSQPSLILREQSFSVIDQATGIPLTSLGYLLVPSLSSKKILAQNQYSPSLGVKTGFNSHNQINFEFHLIVGQILVKKVVFNQELNGLGSSDDVDDLHYRYGYPEGCIITVQMSAAAQLPVARDDIILNPWVKAELELNLLALLDQALAQNPRYHVNLLIKALAKYTTASYFIPTLLQKLQDQAVLAVPAEYYPYYQTLLAKVEPLTRIYGNDQTLNLTTEDLILSQMPGQANIFLGRQVYFMDVNLGPEVGKLTPEGYATLEALGSDDLEDLEDPDLFSAPAPPVTTAKSSRLLFLPTDTVLSLDRIADLALLYQSQGLIPLGSNWLSQGPKREYITKLAAQFTEPVINSVMVNILTALSGLRVDYQFDVDGLLTKFVGNYYQWQFGLAEALPRVLSFYVKYISLLKPDYAYGQQQHRLGTGLDVYFPKAADIVPGAAGKLIEYYLDYLERVVERHARASFLMIGADVAFQDFEVGEFYGLTNNIIEYLYLSLVRELITEDSLETLPNSTEMVALLKYWRGHLGSPDKVEELLDVFASARTPLPIMQATRAFLRVYRASAGQLGRPNNLAPLRPCDKPNYIYYLSRLIEEAFRGPLQDFYTLSRSLPRQPGTLPIQILEIAINEGTTKEPLQAMIIETVQNSLDAARAASAAGITKPLEISLAQSGQQISYQIKDYVGIPADGLLSLSIPFLSTKSVANADTAAGEMGSGFFNVYRRASLVNIVTVRDGFETIILDRPIRGDEAGRVLDISRNISVLKTNKPNGTTITVYIPSTEPTEEITQMLVICQTLVIAAAKELILNGQAVILPRTRYYSGINIIASYTDVVLESVVLTKGAPYTTLSQFLDQPEFKQLKQYAGRYLTTNLIINLVKGYTPTQSRTAIVLADQASLVLDIQSAIFYYILYIQATQPTTNQVPNFTSSGPVDQVLPPLRVRRKFPESVFNFEAGSADFNEQVNNSLQRMSSFRESRPDHSQYFNDLDDFIWNLVPYGSEVSLSQLIHRYLAEVRAGKSLTEHPAENGFMSPVAFYWLRSKDLTPAIEAVNLNVTKLSAENLTLLNFANRFVQAYWQRLPQQYRTMATPPVQLALTEPGSLGEYSPRSHSIVLSTGFITATGTVPYLLAEPPANLTYDSLLDYLQNGGMELFGKRNPAAILIHELEHAWRASGHEGDDSHGNIKLSLNGPAKDYTFDQAANAMYDYVLGQGLLKDLVT